MLFSASSYLCCMFHKLQLHNEIRVNHTIRQCRSTAARKWAAIVDCINGLYPMLLTIMHVWLIFETILLLQQICFDTIVLEQKYEFDLPKSPFWNVILPSIMKRVRRYIGVGVRTLNNCQRSWRTKKVEFRRYTEIDTCNINTLKTGLPITRRQSIFRMKECYWNFNRIITTVPVMKLGVNKLCPRLQRRFAMGIYGTVNRSCSKWQTKLPSSKNWLTSDSGLRFTFIIPGEND
jgi:hypothetical protein